MLEEKIENMSDEEDGERVIICWMRRMESETLLDEEEREGERVVSRWPRSTLAARSTTRSTHTGETHSHVKPITPIR